VACRLRLFVDTKVLKNNGVCKLFRTFNTGVVEKLQMLSKGDAEGAPLHAEGPLLHAEALPLQDSCTHCATF
jgi:hypothetical protein